MSSRAKRKARRSKCAICEALASHALGGNVDRTTLIDWFVRDLHLVAESCRKVEHEIELAAALLRIEGRQITSAGLTRERMTGMRPNLQQIPRKP